MVAVHVGLVTLINGFELAAAVVYTEAGLLGLVLSHGLCVISLARGWHLLELRGWLIRSVPVSALAGVLLIVGLQLITTALSPLLLRALEGFREVQDLEDAEVGLGIYWSGILFIWHSLFYGYLILQRLRRAEVRQWQLEAAVSEAELRALKAQLDPHFIFNCLNGIRALVEEDPPRAREMITRLSGILRYTLGVSDDATVPLRQEIETVQNYLALEAVRFEDRLQYELDVADDTLGVLLPPMIVQHMVENGIKHGIGKRPGPGRLSIASRREGQRLTVEVRNEGRLPADSRGGVGLKKSMERLRLIYGSEADIQLQERDATVSARLSIPIESSREPGRAGAEPA